MNEPAVTKILCGITIIVVYAMQDPLNIIVSQDPLLHSIVVPLIQQ